MTINVQEHTNENFEFRSWETVKSLRWNSSVDLIMY
jgi:hypothetical protein